MSVGIPASRCAVRPTDVVLPMRLSREAMDRAPARMTVAWAVAASLVEAGKMDDSRAVEAVGASLKAATRDQLVIVASGDASTRLLAEMSLTAVSPENARLLAAAELQERRIVLRADLRRLTRWERYAVPAGGWIAAVIAAGIALLK